MWSSFPILESLTASVSEFFTDLRTSSWVSEQLVVPAPRASRGAPSHTACGARQQAQSVQVQRRRGRTWKSRGSRAPWAPEVPVQEVSSLQRIVKAGVTRAVPVASSSSGPSQLRCAALPSSGEAYSLFILTASLYPVGWCMVFQMQPITSHIWFLLTTCKTLKKRLKIYCAVILYFYEIFYKIHSMSNT